MLCPFPFLCCFTLHHPLFRHLLVANIDRLYVAAESEESPRVALISQRLLDHDRALRSRTEHLRWAVPQE